MKEHVIMEMVGMFTGLLLVLTLAAVSLFFFQVQDVNSFRQTVNYQIERGGLTPEAIAHLENYSETFYNGRFTVSSQQLNQGVEFGEKVEYIIQGVFSIPFLPIPDIQMQFNGTGVSHVR